MPTKGEETGDDGDWDNWVLLFVSSDGGGRAAATRSPQFDRWYYVDRRMSMGNGVSEKGRRVTETQRPEHVRFSDTLSLCGGLDAHPGFIAIMRAILAVAGLTVNLKPWG